MQPTSAPPGIVQLAHTPALQNPGFSAGVAHAWPSVTALQDVGHVPQEPAALQHASNKP
jgi:hypothetical protein